MYNPESIAKKIVVHCKPEALETIKRRVLNWSYSKQFGQDDIDVVAIDYDDLDDEDFVMSLGLDYNLTNCIELVGVI